MSRRGVVLVLGAAAVVVSGGSSLGAQAIPVTVGGQTSSLVGVQFDVPIQFDLSARAEKLGSFALRLEWSPTILQFVGHANGTFGAVTINQDSVAEGILRWSGVNPAGVGGKLTVGMFTFVPIQAAGDVLIPTVSEAYAAGTFADLLPSVSTSSRIYCPALGRWGDIDADAAVNSRDALMALSASVGLAVPDVDITLGDVDANGQVNARDALIILSNAVGLPVTGFRVLSIAGGSCVAGTLAGMSLDPGATTLVAGQAVAYAANVTDAGGNVVAVTDLFWRSSNPQVAVATADGRVQGVGAGTALITGFRVGGDSASALVTVVGHRTVHWADALAYGARNRLGSATLPFATIQDALDFAQSGDTVRVRSGRYLEAPEIERSVTVVGDSTGPLPLIGDVGVFGFGLLVDQAQRVELAYVAVDTAFFGVVLFSADTAVLRGVEVRTGGFGVVGVLVDRVGVLRISRSRLEGNAGALGAPALEVAGGIGLLVIDTTSVTGFESGLELFNVDSLVVRGSTFSGNADVAINLVGGDFFGDTAHFTAAVFSHNRFLDNDGSLALFGVRSARFDHNLFSELNPNGSENVIDVLGHGGAVVTFTGDSIIAGDRRWLVLEPFDSLNIDSLTVHVHEVDGGKFRSGRVSVVRHSKFTTLENEMIIADAGDRDSTLLVLRGVLFSGYDSAVANKAATGVRGVSATIDADSITGFNLDQLFGLDDHSIVLRHATLTHANNLVYNSCDGIRVDASTTIDVSAPVQANPACSPGDTVLVENSSFAGAGVVVETHHMPTIFRNNVVTNTVFALSLVDTNAVVMNNQFSGITERGIDFVGSHPADTAIITGNSITCTGTGSGIGIRGENAAFFIRNNQVVGCNDGIDIANSSVVAPDDTIEVRGNHVTMAPGGGYGGISFSGSDDRIVVVNDTVVGSAFTVGSIVINVSGYPAIPFARLDPTRVTGATIGIVAHSADQLFIRDNVILDTGPFVEGNINLTGAIVLDAAAASNVVAHVLRNRISRSKTNGIIVAAGQPNTVTVLVDSNMVKGVDSVGVWVADHSGALVRKNSIDSTGGDAFRLSDDFGRPTTIVNFNNFTRSKRYGITVLTDGSLNAQSNWWGESAGPGGSAGISGSTTADSINNVDCCGSVDFSNFLTAPVDGGGNFAAPRFAGIASALGPVPTRTVTRPPRAVVSAPRAAFEKRAPVADRAADATARAARLAAARTRLDRAIERAREVVAKAHAAPRAGGAR